MKFTTLISEVTVSSNQNPTILKIHLRNDKTMTYAVKPHDGMVINKDLEIEYEPFPSSRTEEFMARTRFQYDEALDLAKKYLRKQDEKQRPTKT